MWVTLQRNGRVKRIKEGFAFWFIFFGPIYALFKGDLTGFIVLALLGSALSALIPGIGFIAAVAINMVFSLSWSKSYIRRLRAKGWV